jgi:TRAP-type C4-dicarboxylate transport system substrate-binding protein
MWDGLWCTINRRAWQRLPDDVRQVVSRNIDAAAMLEREDIAKENETLQGVLTSKGMVFNTVEKQPFREALREKGFYKKWRDKYGEELWAVLEKSVGKLS